LYVITDYFISNGRLRSSDIKLISLVVLHLKHFHVTKSDSRTKTIALSSLKMQSLLAQFCIKLMVEKTGPVSNNKTRSSL